MGQLVGHDAGNLLRRQLLKQPGRGGNGGVLRVAAGGKGVGLGIVDDIDLRHRQAGALRQLAHDIEKLRRRTLVGLNGAVHAQNDLVGVPEAEKVHGGGNDQRHDGAAAAAEQIAEAHEDGGHGRQQHGGLHGIHRQSSVIAARCRNRVGERQYRKPVPSPI